MQDVDPSHYFGAAPGVDLQKYTNGADADEPPGPAIDIGAAIQWTYVVTNSGNQALSQVVVTDNQGVAVSCPATTLAPDEEMTCTGAPATAVRGQYANVGTVTAVSVERGPVIRHRPVALLRRRRADPHRELHERRGRRCPDGAEGSGREPGDVDVRGHEPGEPADPRRRSRRRCPASGGPAGPCQNRPNGNCRAGVRQRRRRRRRGPGFERALAVQGDGHRARRSVRERRDRDRARHSRATGRRHRPVALHRPPDVERARGQALGRARPPRPGSSSTETAGRRTTLPWWPTRRETPRGGRSRSRRSRG